jgi:3',5'-cyclic AMP phosphodiesterase CpdA
VSRRPLVSAIATVASVLALGLVPPVSAATQPDAAGAAGTGEAPRGSTQKRSLAARTVSVVAVGDIACAPGKPATRTRCRQAETARLTRRIDPDAVLALGDLQYENGTLSQFRNSYDRSWGTVKERTHPIPGNHEYNTAGAAGYFAYFVNRQPGPAGYYARRLGTWQVYLLNSNCGEINCDNQFAWLNRHLDANPSRCTIFATHHPRYSSGMDTSNVMGRFFRIAYRHDVDLVLSGHDHFYERFRRMNGEGERRKDGVMQIISGAGGASHTPYGARRANSVYANDTRFGVLKLALRPGSFKFKFKTIAGTAPDSGKTRCR